MIDAGLVSQEFGLIAAHVFAHRPRRIATTSQRGAGGVEFASVDKCHGLLAYRRELRPVVPQAGKLRPQIEQLIGGRIEARGDFVVRNTRLTEL
jgi:hypothetical protein